MLDSDLKTVVIKIKADTNSALQNIARLNKELEGPKNNTGAGLKTFIASVGVAAAAVKTFNAVIGATREFDILNAGLVTATGNTENASAAFSVLEEFAAKTPYSLQQSVRGFTQLVNLGLTPSEEALESYGNTAAAMGKDLSQMIEAVADASTGEFERLKEFGIKAQSEGESVRFIFRGVTTTVAKNAADIEKYLMDLGQAKFAGAMANRMASLDGKLSNLQDSWDATLRNIGRNGLGDVVGNGVSKAIEWLDAFNAKLASGEFGHHLDAMAAQFSGWVTAFCESIDIAEQWFSDDTDQMKDSGFRLGSFLGSTFKNFGSNTLAFLQIMANGLFAFWNGVLSGAKLVKNSVTAVFTDKTVKGAFAEFKTDMEASVTALKQGVDDAADAAMAAQQKAAEEEQKASNARAQRLKSRKSSKGVLEKYYKGGKDTGSGAGKKAPKTSTRGVDQSAQYVASLEKQAALLGMSQSQVRAYELAERGLTGALKNRAEAALQLLEAEEKKQQSDINAKQNADLQATLLRAKGLNHEAALLEIDAKYDELLKDFAKSGNETGASLLKELIPVEKAKARLDALEAQWRQSMSRLQAEQEAIQIRVNAGLLSEGEGRRQIVKLQEKSAAQLREVLPEMEALGQTLGEDAILRVQSFRNELDNLVVSTDELAPLWDDIGRGFGDALNGMITRTGSWKETLIGLFRQVSNAFLQHVVIKPFQEWVASQARMLMMKKGFQQQEQTMDMAAGSKRVGQTMSEASTTVSAKAAEAGSGAASAVADIPYVGPILAVAAMATVFAAVMALMSKISKHADGGHIRGPGTGTSDSILNWLSNGEYVTRAAVVSQPGALSFLTDFNERGMVAIPDWASTIPRHSTGGLAGIPAPARPAPVGVSPTLGKSQNKSTTLNNAVNLHVYDDPERIANAAFNSRQGQENFIVMLSKNPAKVRSVLGL